MGDLRIAREKGYIDKLPCFASVGHFLQGEEITQTLYEMAIRSSLPLKAIETDFAVDSSGFSTCRFKRWYNFKYGKESDFRVWIKAHLICGVKTNIVTSVRLSEATGGDSPYLKTLVEETAINFKINEVSADKAYSSRENLYLVEGIGAVPYIPFKSSAKPRAGGSLLWKKMWHYYNLRREEFLEHYHKRSNIESTVYMIKSKFGGSLRSKTKTAQVNELLAKVLCHNICVVIQEMHELGFMPNS